MTGLHIIASDGVEATILDGVALPMLTELEFGVGSPATRALDLSGCRLRTQQRERQVADRKKKHEEEQQRRREQEKANAASSGIKPADQRKYTKAFAKWSEGGRGLAVENVTDLLAQLALSVVGKAWVVLVVHFMPTSTDSVC